MLRKQRERAVATMSELQTRKDPQSPGMTPEYEEDVKREDEELATLGGKTRLVPRKPSSSADVVEAVKRLLPPSWVIVPYG